MTPKHSGERRLPEWLREQLKPEQAAIWEDLLRARGATVASLDVDAIRCTVDPMTPSPSPADLRERILALEQENARLRAELEKYAGMLADAGKAAQNFEEGLATSQQVVATLRDERDEWKGMEEERTAELQSACADLKASEVARMSALLDRDAANAAALLLKTENDSLNTLVTDLAFERDSALLVLRRIGSGTCERPLMTKTTSTLTLRCDEGNQVAPETMCYPCQAREAVKEK